MFLEEDVKSEEEAQETRFMASEFHVLCSMYLVIIFNFSEKV